MSIQTTEKLKQEGRVRNVMTLKFWLMKIIAMREDYRRNLLQIDSFLYAQSWKRVSEWLPTTIWSVKTVRDMSISF